MFKAVIFDHDGVIVNSESLQKEAWLTFFKRYHITVSEEIWGDRIRGRTSVDVVREFLPGEKTDDECRALAKEKAEITYRLFQGNLIPVEGISRFFHVLTDGGIAIAVATSGARRNVELSLTKLGLIKLVKVLVTADDITKGKPDPEVYSKTAQALQLESSDCLAFEDAISGALAARAAGMKVGVVTTSHRIEEFPEGSYDFSINDFSDITMSKLKELLK